MLKKEPTRAEGYNNWSEKNILEGINTKLINRVEWIINLENRIVAVT